MRLDTTREKTITNLSGSQKFKVNASAKAFQILSSGIYERKIEAIVRELSCNCFDSHVEAGVPDLPFNVHLPTPLDPKFVVEDFGVGLSEEQVYSVYTTYFESTKTENNDVIGALGLGSKTPFSYTDSFSITARKDGVEAVFTASIGESGEPEVVKLYSRPWTGSNGVKITVDVSNHDIYEFIACAEKVYSWFKVKPTLNKTLDYDVKESILDAIDEYGYHFEPQNGYRSGVNFKVVMGTVAYDLDMDDVRSRDQGDLNLFLNQLDKMRANVFIRLAIGEADVAASRETLSLDDRTKENIRKKLDLIRVNFQKNSIAKAQQMSSVFEVYNGMTPHERAMVKDEVINGFTVGSLLKTMNLTTAHSYSENYDIAFYGDYGNSRLEARSKRVDSAPFNTLVTRDLSSDPYTVQVIINDCGRKSGIKDAIKQNHSLRRKIMVVSDKNTVLTATLEAIISDITYGCYSIIYTSSFWDGKLAANKSASGGLASKTIRAQIRPKGRSGFSYFVKDFSDIDTSRWAYCDRSGGTYFIQVAGQYMTGHELTEVMEELDLDGVIAYNGNNEGKIKRTFKNSLQDLILSKANSSGLKVQKTKETLRRHSSTKFKVLPEYLALKGLVDSFEQSYPMCSKWLPKTDEIKSELITCRSVIEKHIENFEASIEELRDSNRLLNTVLSSSMQDDAVEDTKEYIEYLKQKKEK
jgi:hypothetical protein